MKIELRQHNQYVTTVEVSGSIVFHTDPDGVIVVKTSDNKTILTLGPNGWMLEIDAFTDKNDIRLYAPFDDVLVYEQQ